MARSTCKICCSPHEFSENNSSFKSSVLQLLCELLNNLGAVTDNVVEAPTVIIPDESTATIQVGISGVYLDLMSIVFSNPTAEAINAVVQSHAGGDTILSMSIPAYDTRGIVYKIPLKQGTIGGSWGVTAGTDLHVSAQYIKRMQ